MEKLADLKKIFLILVIIFLTNTGNASEEIEEKSPIRFVFAGHIRGPRNFTVNSLVPYFVKDIDGVEKDFVLIGGDTICGYITAYDEVGLNKEWDMVDKYFDKIDVPVYRVPGNHDWHSITTKKVFNQRYGPEYFSFIKNDVMVIGLNTVKLCPDETLDWAGIWRSDSHLPNISQVPEGQQWDFFTDQLNKASKDPGVRHVVIFMGGTLWKEPETKDAWWGKVHPILVKHGKVKIVFAGEAGDDKSDAYLKKDGILYLRNGWGITDDDDFSLRGTYFHVVFEEGKEAPEIYSRFINMTPEYFQSFIGAIPDDTQRHMKARIKRTNGTKLSFINSVRVYVKDWMNEHIRIYNRTNNIKIAVGMSIIGVAFIGLLLKAFIFRKRG